MNFNLESNYDDLLDRLSAKYTKAEIDLAEEYLKMGEEASKNYITSMDKMQESIDNKEKELKDLETKINALIIINKKQEEEKEQLDFFRLKITEQDQKEIEALRSIESCLRNPRALNKIIWETYYRNPCSELLGRIIENNKKTGIYKITNINNSKVYIGQAVNLQDRIKTHIKCGVGIDTPKNRLYSEMVALGPENFTFEIVEYCNKSELNEKEKFWIKTLQSQEWGYNMTGGGS